MLMGGGFGGRGSQRERDTVWMTPAPLQHPRVAVSMARGAGVAPMRSARGNISEFTPPPSRTVRATASVDPRRRRGSRRQRGG